jgi:multidrug efflux pump subunit AcrA (membrane-fusion protein)
MAEPGAVREPIELHPVRLPELDLLTLHRRLRGLFTAARPHEQNLQESLGLLLGLTNGGGAIYLFHDAATGAWAQGPRIFSRQAMQWSEGLMGELEQIAAAALEQDKVHLAMLSGGARASVLAAPAHDPQLGRGALVLLLVLGAQDPSPFVTILQLIAAAPALQGAMADEAADLLAAQAVRQLMSAPDADAAWEQLAGRVRAALGCAQAFLGIKRVTGSVRLAGVAGRAQFERRSAVARHIEEGMLAALRADKTMLLQGLPGEPAEPVLLSLSQALGCRTLAAVPLPARHGRPGVLLLAWTEAGAATAARLTAITQYAATLGPAIGLAHHGFPAGPRRALARLHPERHRRELLAAGVAMAALLLFPVPDALEAQATLQPVQRRYVSARFDGVLDEVRARPGDRVRADQALALMDGRELNWRLASLAAERDQARKKQDVGMAAGETAAAQLAALDVQRLEVQIALLEDNLKHLEITSPLEGQLLAGDLQRERGAPVRKGQQLFEVAPLERMLVEMAVPAEDIARLEKGGQAALVVDGLPGRRWDAPLERVFPRARVQEGRNVFIAEIEIANADGVLRPGMKGRAKLDAGWRPLLWQMLERPLTRVWRWLFW